MRKKGRIRVCGSVLGENHSIRARVFTVLFAAVGVDNVFILLSAWRSTPSTETLEHRMEETFAGLSFISRFKSQFHYVQMLQ